MTPGPWEQRSFNVFVEGKGTLCSVRNPWNNESERLANAQAIAAVPDMVAALKEACDLLAERTFGSHARSPGHNARLVLEDALRKAGQL